MACDCNEFKSEKELLCEISNYLSVSSGGGAGATEPTQLQVLAELVKITSNTDSIGANQLTQIANQALIIASLNAVDANTDGIEVLIAQTNTLVSAFSSANNVDLVAILNALNANQTTNTANLNAIVSAIQTFDAQNGTDLAALLAATNLQTTTNTTNLASLQADLNVFATANGVDLTAIQALLTSFQSAMATSQALLDTSINDFAAQNTIDINLVNTSIGNFATANNTALSLINATLSANHTAALAELQAINANTDGIEGLLTTIIANQNLTVVTATTSLLVPNNGVGVVPANAKSVHFYVSGTGATVNGVVRPNRWSHTYEYDNDVMQSYAYSAGAKARIWIDYIV